MDARHIEEISVDPASAAPTKCDIREWPSSARRSRGNNPVKGRARSLFIPDRNYSLTKYLADADGDPREFYAEQADCWSRNFQNMQENRLPGERPDRHPAAGIWERTSPRFHRDRSRRDACPTLRPRPENNPVKGQARNLFIPDRNYCHYQISRGRRRRIQENFAE